MRKPKIKNLWMVRMQTVFLLYIRSLMYVPFLLTTVGILFVIFSWIFPGTTGTLSAGSETKSSLTLCMAMLALVITFLAVAVEHAFAKKRLLTLRSKILAFALPFTILYAAFLLLLSQQQYFTNNNESMLWIGWYGFVLVTMYASYLLTKLLVKIRA